LDRDLRTLQWMVLCSCSFVLTDFKGSKGFLHRFRECYGIHHRTICGEESITPKDVESSWREEQLKYSPEDIFRANETVLFYKLMPSKILALKGEQCTGGKNSKTKD
jgi:hypothetical protein